MDSREYLGDPDWDPGQFSRLPHLPTSGLDPNRYPVHPPGTWESALTTLAAGYRPTDSDIKALRHWSKDLNVSQRKAYLDRQRAARLSITSAAREVMDRREVLAMSNLENRIHSHMAGACTHPEIRNVLTAVTTPTMLEAEAEPGTHPVAHLYRQHYHLLGKHIHYFSRSREDLLAHPARVMATSRQLGLTYGDKGARFTSATSKAANSVRWEREHNRATPATSRKDKPA